MVRRSFIALITVLSLLCTGPPAHAASPAFVQVAGSPLTDAAVPAALAYSPDGQYLAVANNDGTVSMYAVDLSTGALSQVRGSPFAAGSAGASSLSFDPSGSFLAVTEAGGVAVLAVNASSGALSVVPGSPFATSGYPVSVAYSPTGSLLVAANQQNSVAVFSVDSETGALSQASGSPVAVGSNSLPAALAFSPSGALLAVSDFEGDNVYMYSVNSSTGALTAAGSPVSTGAASFGLAISPFGDVLAAPDSEGDTVATFTVNSFTGALYSVAGSPFTTGQDPYSVAFNADGQLLATANEGDGMGDLSIFSVSSAGTLTSVDGSPFSTGSAPEFVGFNPVDDSLATANSGGKDISVYALPAPTAKVALSPAPEQDASPIYAVGQRVTTTFSCSDPQYAPGIVGCTDSNGLTAPDGALDTSVSGNYTYSVTATSADGESSTTTVDYTVGGTSVGSAGGTTGGGSGGSGGGSGAGRSEAGGEAARFGSMSVHATSARVVIRCVGQKGKQCKGTLVARAKSQRRAGAADHTVRRAERAATRTGLGVTVARARFTVGAGSKRSLVIAVNRVGRRVLAKSYRLPAVLTVPGTSLKRSIAFAYRRFPHADVAYDFDEPAGASYTLIKNLVVTNLRVKARITVGCVGGGCPFSRHVVIANRPSANLVPLTATSHFEPGAELTLTIAAADYVSKVLRILMPGDGRAAVVRELCQLPGESHPAACAS